MSETNPIPVVETPKTDIKKKTIFASAGVITVIIIGIVVAISVGSNQNKTPVKDEQSGFNYLPENTCPSAIFEENGKKRADLNGKPFVITDAQNTWILANCKNVSGVSNSGANGNEPQPQPQTNPQPSAEVETEPPLLLGSLGFNFGDYDPATQTAGDIKFTKTPLPFNQIYSPFGQPDPRSQNNGLRNPQPVVILPLGTKVQSIVTGVVVEVKELYSGDMTVWVAKSKTSTYFYETEHIINPTVAVGDNVTAGQIIGEVSDYDSHNNPGFGLIEIGILHSDGPGVPKHICPLQYLDTSIKSKVESQLNKLYAAWNDYLGQTIYNYSTFETPGCVVKGSVEG